MKKYGILWKTVIILVFSFASSYCFLNQLYFTGSLLVVIILLTAYWIYNDRNKIIRRMEFMISTIRHGDMNISFPGSTGEEGKLARSMNEALAAFHSRLYNSVVSETENEAWQKLIRVLTHEIMNSIAPVISISETMTELREEGESNKEDYELMVQSMRTIHRRSKGLLDFVENYRQLTRIPEPDKKAFKVKNLFDNLQSLYAHSACPVTLSVHPDELVINGDQSLLEQVLINLIKNAMEAAAENKSPQIRIEAGKKKGGQVITVWDNGEGIAPEAINEIFVPFYTTKKGGSGIGLSISRQIMNRHGGTLSVESGNEKGTTFTLWFPPGMEK